MDEEELHNRLNARITEVFDNYEDTTADEGWELLRQKFPKEKKDRGLIWLWYGAAAILLLGFGLWFMQGPTNVKPQVAINIKPAAKNKQVPKINIDSDATQNGGKVNTMSTQGYAQVNTSPVNANMPKQSSITVAKTKVGGVVNASGPKTKINQPVVMQPQRDGIVAQSPVPVTSNYVVDNPAKANAAATANADHPAVADSADKNNRVLTQNPTKPAATKPVLSSAEALSKLFAETANSPKNNSKGPKRDKKAVIGIYAATYFNYAEGSDNRVNMGAGLSSDFSITNKLKLSTGISIAQNSLNYDYSKSTNSTQSLDVARATGLNSDLNTGLSNGLSSSSFYDASVRSAPVSQNYSANLIGLDIPINLKYQFNPKKNDSYISAGLSSGTFINETYKLEYTVARQALETTTKNNFSDFYFAKTLNVSFGVGYPLGKNNRLVVEPFLKYPLSGLGSQQIKFGAGGVNLKLNFSAPKK